MTRPNTLTRRRLLAAPALAPAILRGASPPLNVVFIMTDDHGAWALNCAGCGDLHTPNLDRLAREGMSFTRAFACTPVCSASRATYLTGRLPSHHGVQDYLMGEDSVGPAAKEFLKGQPTFSAMLAQHGYTLGMCGKWHMGGDDRAQAGFSYWASALGGYRNPPFSRNGTRVPTKGFKDDTSTSFGIEFIEQNRDGPFFLYLATSAPHVPYDYQPEEDRKWYENSKFPCFPDEPIHPWHCREMNGRIFPTLQDFNNRQSKWGYSALVSSIDRNVGRLVTRLEELGLRRNTLIVFTADQGHNCGHHGIWGKGNSTAPFNMYDTSLQVPLIWNLPGRIREGQSTDAMVSAYDFSPTIVDYLGVPLPPDRRRAGRSYAAFLRGEKPRWRNEVYFEYEYVRGVRTQNLKYVERTKEWPGELYDLEADPGETRNAIAEPGQAGNLAALQRRLHGHFAAAGAPPLEQWRGTTTQRLAVYGR
jgi:choline-sulfatase